MDQSLSRPEIFAYRHGLRGQEPTDLEWSQVEFNARDAVLHVKRIKGSRASVHTMRTDEVRALRQLHKHAKGPFVFETERGGPFTRDALNKQLKNIAANGHDDCGEAQWAINTST